MDLKGTRYEGVDYIHLVQNKEERWTLVNTLLNLTVVPKNVQDKRVAKVRK
jgi:hypothetical protein